MGGVERSYLLRRVTPQVFFAIAVALRGLPYMTSTQKWVVGVKTTPTFADKQYEFCRHQEEEGVKKCYKSVNIPFG